MVDADAKLAAPAAALATPARRRLRFEALDDALAEAERLVAADRAGRLARVGNWTVGQSLGHLAAWIDFGFDGYPPAARPPLPVRVGLRLVRGVVMRRGMPPGVRLGRVPGGTVAADPLDADEGLRRYRAALARLTAGAPPLPSPAFGRLSRADAVRLNLRHAELHLGFLVPE